MGCLCFQDTKGDNYYAKYDELGGYAKMSTAGYCRWQRAVVTMLMSVADFDN